MKLLIVVHHRFALWNVPAWFRERLTREFPRVETLFRDSYDGIEAELRNTEILFTISLRPEQFAAAEHLRWIHAPTAAVQKAWPPQWPPVGASGTLAPLGPPVAPMSIAPATPLTPPEQPS